MYRISSSYVGMLVAMLQAEGLDAVRLCREAGIDMCLLAQEDAFFTRASAYRLMGWPSWIRTIRISASRLPCISNLAVSSWWAT